MAGQADEDEVLGGRYRLIERVGVGGMAAVFLAEDPVLRRRVAIKRLHAERVEQAAHRFQREAVVAAGLSHPNLVRVFDAFSEGGELVIVMEYIDGPDLSRALRTGPLEPARAVAILGGLAAGLDHIHEGGVVHRDVKPSNVLLGEGDTAKLTDLGIAKVLEDTSTTQANAVPGSVPYMSPEQLAGNEVGPASDVYAFALVAYEVLSGERAQPGPAPQVSHRALNEPPPDVREAGADVPAAVADALRRGMARDPAERPATAGELAGEVADALDAGARGAQAPATRTMPALAPAPADTVTQDLPPAAPPPRRPTEPSSASSAQRHDRSPARAERAGGGRRRLPLVLALLAVAAIAAAVLLIGGEGEDTGDPTGRQGADAGGARSGGGGGGGGNDSAGDQAAPAQAVEGFYEAAAADDFDSALALASPSLVSQLGGEGGLESTFATLESIEFTALEVVSESGTSAEVSLSTRATHSDRVEECDGVASLVSNGEEWLVDQLGGISCEVVG